MRYSADTVLDFIADKIQFKLGYTEVEVNDYDKDVGTITIINRKNVYKLKIDFVKSIVLFYNEKGKLIWSNDTLDLVEDVEDTSSFIANIVASFVEKNMNLGEAKKILKKNGYLLEVMGKTNIEDFNKMKTDVYNLTKIPGSNFNFVTGNKKGSVEDERSTMELGWGKGGTYTYDTGRPGFKRYRKLSKEEVLDLIKEKQKEIEKLGYNVEFTNDGVKIWMPKSELTIEDERDMVLFGIFNDGGNCWSSRDDENWYWATSEDETAAEFRERLRRAGERMAQKNYREYVKGSYGVRVFKNIEDFKKACEKVGLSPNLSDYE